MKDCLWGSDSLKQSCRESMSAEKCRRKNNFVHGHDLFGKTIILEVPNSLQNDLFRYVEHQQKHHRSAPCITIYSPRSIHLIKNDLQITNEILQRTKLCRLFFLGYEYMSYVEDVKSLPIHFLSSVLYVKLGIGKININIVDLNVIQKGSSKIQAKAVYFLISVQLSAD